MDKILQDLVHSYDSAAEERDKFEVSDWKKDLRSNFLGLLNEEGKSKLIDIGAGTGIHAKFFHDHRIDVTCIDLSPAHVQKCKDKGLKSFIINVLEMDSLDQEYDCAFALNSLLHIQTLRLPNVLSNISKILIADGLFFWGQYGGEYREGVYQDDNHEPKRFFSLLTDEQMYEMTSRDFTVEKFDIVELESLSPLYFQSMFLRVKSGL